MIYALTTALLAAMTVSLYGIIVSFGDMLNLRMR